MLFRSGVAKLTVEENEIFEQFSLLELFHIRPWEYSEDREPYKEDIANMITLKRLQLEAQRYNMEREQWRSDTQARMSSRFGR